jgi:hypothetical protein
MEALALKMTFLSRNSTEGKKTFSKGFGGGGDGDGDGNDVRPA